MRELKKSFDFVANGLKNLDQVWSDRKGVLFQFFKKFKVMDHNLQLLNFDIDKEKLLKSESLGIINDVTFKVDCMAKILEELRGMHQLQVTNLEGFQQIGRNKKSMGNFGDGVSHKSGISSMHNQLAGDDKITEVIKNLEGAVSYFILFLTHFLLFLTNFQEPWSYTQFDQAIAIMDKFMSRLKSDYAQLQEDLSHLLRYDTGEDNGYGGSKNKNHVPPEVIEDARQSLLGFCKEFAKGGVYSSLDFDYTVWIKNLTLSLDFFDSGFEDLVTEGKNILEQSLEIVFLREKVYPFLLTSTHNLILKGTQDFDENNTVHRSLLKEWKNLDEILYGFKLKLQILEGKISVQWLEAKEEIDQLKDQEIKLTRTVKYAWGKVSAIKTQEQLLREIDELQKDIESLNKRRNPESYEMNTISSKLKEITLRIHSLIPLFQKYSSFSPDHLKYELNSVQSNYSKLCMKLANLDKNSGLSDLQMMQAKGDKSAINLNIVRATSISQAYTPTMNEDFIINTLDKLINEERYSECPNHQKVKISKIPKNLKI